MNKIPKYRVWHKIEKRFVDLRSIDFELDNIGYDCQGEAHYYDVAKFDEIVFQQFTGLMDKNGKEIYEGDVVNVQRSFTRPYVKDGKIEYKTIDGGLEVGQVIWWMIKAAFIIVYKGYDDMEDFSYCYSCEVIGNIFEHSELLKNE
jgi:uncharacterized phage protein (TIGR01671 family)